MSRRTAAHEPEHPAQKSSYVFYTEPCNTHVMTTANRNAGFVTRCRQLADAANPVFATVALLAPTLLLGVAVALNNLELLFYTHVASGAMWFGLGTLLPILIGPTMGTLTPDAAKQVAAKLTPKVGYLGIGLGFGTVASGTVLAKQMGYLATGGSWVMIALIAGWALFIFGTVFTHRYHLQSYYEAHSDNPDPAVLDSLEQKTVLVGIVETIWMFFIILTMTQLRL